MTLAGEREKQENQPRKTLLSTPTVGPATVSSPSKWECH